MVAEESAVSRLVQGPRGDDKNGCREAWEASCDMKGKKSHIKSYRSNRFNNFFESADRFNNFFESASHSLSLA